MKNNNDFDLISSKFSEENVTPPESLNEENIKALLEKESEEVGKNVVKIKKKKSVWRPLIAVAACFAIIVASGVYANQSGVFSRFTSEKEAEVEAGVMDGIETYNNYSELKSAVDKINERNSKEQKSGTTFGGILKSKSAVQEDMAAADSVADENSAETAQKGPSDSNNSNYAKTNVQVDAVDEGDILKTDGKYLYYIEDDYNAVVAIFSAKDGVTELQTKIEASVPNANFCELYIKGDRLILIGERSDYSNVKKNDYYDYTPTEGYTFIHTYSIKNIKEPKLIGKYEQSGYYNSSRMIDNCVYLVSNFGDFYYSYKNDDNCVPCATGEDGKTARLPVNNISGIKDGTDSRYSVIGALDITGKGKAVKKTTKAILGVNQQIYCNEKNLYLTGTINKKLGKNEYQDYTNIVRLTTDKTNISVSAAGRVKGRVNDQFSMDENDGVLRIALTDYDYDNGEDINCLYTLDKELNVIGQTEGFAKGEHIEAVRFMGDTAYVITYEQTDPLFIMDLSSPENPKITGEVKIDGFSSFLTPVDENTMLGIGYATKEEEWGIVQDGLKLALFDISNKNKPRVLDEFEIHDSGSEAQYNHKALTINREKGYFAIPFSNYDYEEYDEFANNDDFDDDSYLRDFENGVLVIRVKNGKLSVDNLKTHNDKIIRRCTYIGDFIYAPDANAKEVYKFIVK